MGYTTDFFGEFEFDKPLNEHQIKYIQCFSTSRRMIRNSLMLKGIEDPIRENVGLPIGDCGEFFLGEAIDYKFFSNDKTVVDHNTPPPTQPGLWCKWTVSDDGEKLFWNGHEKFYYYTEWLEYMINSFFKPWGYVLNGCVSFQGEHDDDKGTIYIKNNVVKII